MSKKTETIEIRVSPELKDELQGLSHKRGEPMSQIVRGLVEHEVESFAIGNAKGKNVMFEMKKMAGFGGAALGMLVLAVGWNVATQAPAVAQASVRISFAEIDKDGNGQISEAEYYALPDVQMDDGSLPDEDYLVPAACEAEFADPNVAVMNGPGAMWEGPGFDGVDGDGSGAIEFGEFKNQMLADAQQVFGFYDANGDDFLSLEEFKADIFGGSSMSAACEAAMLAQLPEDPYFDENMRVVYAGMDANRDGKLDVDEFIAGM